LFLWIPVNHGHGAAAEATVAEATIYDYNVNNQPVDCPFMFHLIPQLTVAPCYSIRLLFDAFAALHVSFSLVDCWFVAFKFCH
jgi:hypothetical protein